jgi:serine protease
MGLSWLAWAFVGGKTRRGAARKNGSRRQKRSFQHRPLGEQLEQRRLLAALRDDRPALLSQLGLDVSSSRSSSLLVQFKDGTVGANIAAEAVAGARVTADWSIVPGLRKVELSAGTDLQSALAAYRNDPNVVFAEPDYRVSLNLLPDDPSFGNLWGLNNDGSGGGTLDSDIDAPEAWDVITGRHETIVAVIDTGIDYNHPDLAANIWVNADEIPGNRIDDDKNGYVDDVHGFDFVNRDGDPMDDHFHGTHVAGTIGAVGDNGQGIAGVNWSIQIMALKFLDSSGGGYTSDAIEALNYAVANGAIASNNSWGGGGFSAAFQTAVQNAANKGHIFVAAAGNDGSNNDTEPFYPAGYNVDNVVSVAATDRNDNLAYFSNYGSKSVELAAPGVNIYSTFPTRLTDAMRDGGFSTHYASISGTSMATPHVTGVIALVASLHPDWSYEQIIEQVLNTVDVIPGAVNTITGGRLNAAAAVGNAPPDVLGPRVAATDPTGSINGPIDHVRVRFNETIDATTIGLGDIVSLTGPEGAIAALAVVPVAGSTRQFDITFAPQTVLGDYRLVLGPAISDLAGNLMDQDIDGVGGEDPDDLFAAQFTIVDVLHLPSDDVPAPIPWLTSVGSYLTVNQDLTIADLNVTVDISFPFDGDLTIYLVSPRGTRVNLSILNGGIDADFDNTVFDDEGDLPIGRGLAPFTGSYRPDGRLSAFDGQNAKGTWTLWIDNAPWTSLSLDGEGTLNAWSLQLESSDGPPPPPPPVGNRAPIAKDDAFVGNNVNENVVLTTADLLANDTDPDGNALTVKYFTAPVGGSVTLSPNGTITFAPDPFFQGQAGFDYVVSDGALTDEAHVSIDIKPTFKWHNLRNALDVDGSQSVSPIDAVLIINLLNATGGTSLENLLGGDAGAPTAYYDVSPDNYVTPLDAVMVINYLNAHPSGTAPLASSVQAAGETTGTEAAAAGASINENLAAATQPGRREARSKWPQALVPAAVDQALRSGDLANLLADLPLGRGFRRRLLEL